ncbi:MAG: glycosyltransferase family 2 protein [Pseudomonadota bacterium]
MISGLTTSLMYSSLVVAWGLAAIAAFISTYMAFVVFGSWLYQPKTRLTARRPVFGVVVPAHNEEQGIASTIGQLLASAYPPAALRVLVIADNCTDQTASMARDAGAHVVVRNDSDNRGKGQALDWLLHEHAALFDGVDLIAFIDADMQTDGQFFNSMAAAFADDEIIVAQGRYLVANACRSILSAIGYMSFCYVNHMRPAGRCFWGGTADLKGSGMVFRSPFLLARGWKAHSIAEDIQLGKELMLEGIKVAYVPDARVESEIPATLSQVNVQQSRWEGGKREIYAALLPRILRTVLRNPSPLLLDGLFEMMVPPLSIVIFLNIVGASAAWLVDSVALWVFITSLAIFAAAVLSGLLQNRAPAGVYLRLLAAPAFVMWKAVLLVRVLFSSTPKAWQRTPRDPR